MGLISSAVNFSFGNCTAVAHSRRSPGLIDSASGVIGKGAGRRANAVVMQLKELVKRAPRRSDFGFRLGGVDPTRWCCHPHACRWARRRKISLTRSGPWTP